MARRAAGSDNHEIRETAFIAQIQRHDIFRLVGVEHAFDFFAQSLCCRLRARQFFRGRVGACGFFLRDRFFIRRDFFRWRRRRFFDRRFHGFFRGRFFCNRGFGGGFFGSGAGGNGRYSSRRELGAVWRINAFFPSVFRKNVALSGWRGIDRYTQAGAGFSPSSAASAALTLALRA